MKIVNVVIIAIISFLSISAGLAKVMQTQQEMEFLQGVGLSSFLIIVFGLVQVSGGVLLMPRKTRMLGAVLATSALFVSTVLIFVGGNLVFGLISIIPISFASVIIYQSARFTHNKSLITDASNAGAG